MNKKPDVSIVVVNYNTKDLTADCLLSVAKYTKKATYELMVVDNASTDGSIPLLRNLVSPIANMKLIESKQNLGFGGGNNLGLEKARGRYILLLNSDTKLSEDSISIMVDWIDKNPKIGMATCKLKNPDKTTQGTGGKFPTLFYLFSWGLLLDDLPFFGDLFGSYHPHTPESVLSSRYYEKPHRQDWITGAFMLVRREAYQKVGGFDTNFFMYAEDVEYCYRVKKAGWQIWYLPITSITHLGGASSKGEGVHFLDGMSGRQNSVVGEFTGLVLFYKKHMQKKLWLARIILKTAAAIRFFVWGILQNSSEGRVIYAKTFKSI